MEREREGEREGGGGELVWDHMSGRRRRNCGVGLQLRSDFHTKAWSWREGEGDNWPTDRLTVWLPAFLSVWTHWSGLSREDNYRRRNNEKCAEGWRSVEEGKVKAVLQDQLSLHILDWSDSGVHREEESALMRGDQIWIRFHLGTVILFLRFSLCSCSYWSDLRAAGATGNLNQLRRSADLWWRWFLSLNHFERNRPTVSAESLRSAKSSETWRRRWRAD